MLEMWEAIKIGSLIIYLALLSLFDIKDKRLPLSISAIAAVIGTLLVVVSHSSWQTVVIALVPGALILLIGKVSNQAIGYGDGLAILVMGLFVPCQSILISLLAATTMSGVVALILLIVFRKGKNTELAFIPFLFVGLIIEKGLI
ncbi:MAG: prepilin peptidase [Lachnospiraceae bacterium]|nr:prepilin peptidase [Lachnospiraceae bacterium]MEE1101214.1 prepilin peptidase [Agathobacter sp.]